MRYATLASMLAASLILAAPAVAVGQSCFRGRLEPACRAFTVLEFTGGIRLTEKSVPTDRNQTFLYWSGGYLKNIGSRSALGAAFKLTADSDGHRYGPVARYRRWLGPRSSLDFAPGIYVGGKENFTAPRFPSPTADVALNYRDWLGFAIGIDALRQADGPTQWQWHAGMRFGTWLAPLATLGLGVLAAATY